MFLHCISSKISMIMRSFAIANLWLISIKISISMLKLRQICHLRAKATTISLNHSEVFLICRLSNWTMKYKICDKKLPIIWSRFTIAWTIMISHTWASTNISNRINNINITRSFCFARYNFLRKWWLTFQSITTSSRFKWLRNWQSKEARIFTLRKN